jgi:PDZ domain
MSAICAIVDETIHFCFFKKVGTMIRHVGLHALVAGVMISLPALFACSLSHADDNVLERFAIAKDGDVVLLPVDSGYQRYLFMLGTGSSLSAYDGKFRLGLPVETVSPSASGGKKEIELFKAPDSTLGTLAIHNVETPIRAYNFASARYNCGQPIYGLLGMDFFNRYIVQIDFDEGELRVLKKANADCGQAITVNMRSGWAKMPRPFVPIKLAGMEAQEFLISTGSLHPGSAYLNRELFESLVQNGQLRVEGHALVEESEETTNARVGTSVSLSLGENTVKAPLICEAQQNILGLRFLSRFVVTFDLANATIYLKKGKGFDRPDFFDRSGLGILRIEGRTVVTNVAEGSAAAAKGIKVGDFITKIGPDAAEKVSLFRLRQMLAEPGQTVTLSMWRRFEEWQVEFVVK